MMQKLEENIQQKTMDGKKKKLKKCGALVQKTRKLLNKNFKKIKLN